MPLSFVHRYEAACTHAADTADAASRQTRVRQTRAHIAEHTVNYIKITPRVLPEG